VCERECYGDHNLLGERKNHVCLCGWPVCGACTALARSGAHLSHKGPWRRGPGGGAPRQGARRALAQVAPTCRMIGPHHFRWQEASRQLQGSAWCIQAQKEAARCCQLSARVDRLSVKAREKDPLHTFEREPLGSHVVAACERCGLGGHATCPVGWLNQLGCGAGWGAF
jgi:hypothetical protein